MLAECGMKIVLTFTILSLSLLSMNAFGQVYRCKTPGGGTEYSQVPCGNNAELLQNRAQSIDTTPSKNPYAHLYEREAAQQAYDAAFNAPAPTSPMSSRECEQAMTIATEAIKNKSTTINQLIAIAGAICGRPDLTAAAVALPASQNRVETSRATRRTPAPVPQPIPAPNSTRPDRRTLTNCDATGCYDNAGARYNNMGQNFMGPTGMCRKTLLGWSCP